VASCARTITPAEVEELGRRSYPGRAPSELMTASQTASMTLGYEIVVADASSGRIKTAPKVVVVHAVGGYGRATAVANELA
jgi:hypothetical protein